MDTVGPSFVFRSSRQGGRVYLSVYIDVESRHSQASYFSVGSFDSTLNLLSLGPFGYLSSPPKITVLPYQNRRKGKPSASYLREYTRSSPSPLSPLQKPPSPNSPGVSLYGAETKTKHPLTLRFHHGSPRRFPKKKSWLLAIRKQFWTGRAYKCPSVIPVIFKNESYRGRPHKAKVGYRIRNFKFSRDIRSYTRRERGRYLHGKAQERRIY